MPERPDNVRFRPVAEGEISELSPVARRIWDVAYREIISSEQVEYMIRQMYSEEAIGRDIAQGIRYFWIQQEEEAVGFLAFGPVSAGVPCSLHKIYVNPERQGQGIGGATMRWLEECLVRERASAIELRVNRNNVDSIAFYQKSGFRVDREDCLDIGRGFVMDDFLMIRSLD